MVYHISKSDYDSAPVVKWEDTHDELHFQEPISCTSMICNSSFYDAPFFQYWIQRMNRQLIYRRKNWEFVYIAQTLFERNMLSPGKKGIVFACGQEPLPMLFATFGVEILATDLSAEDKRAKVWLDAGQNAGRNGGLLKRNFNKNSRELISYRDVDMNHIPDDLEGFDFCWSSCALEHLGGLEKGKSFVKNSLKVLKRGGVAVHTTELNLSSDMDTYESERTSVYRKKDIMQLITELEDDGHYVYPMDWHEDDSLIDTFVDRPPYFKKSDMHLRLSIQDYVCTSIGLIIKK